MNPNDNHYITLGIAQTSSKDEIKKAFHKLSLKFHPDKYTGKSPIKNVNLRYQKILKAYEVISDPDKRKLYDQFGDNGPDMNNNSGMQNPFDIFNFFNNRNPFNGSQNGGGKPNPPRQDQNIVINIDLTFSEAYTGVKKTLSINRKIMCSMCKGSCASDPQYIDQCTKCKGHGLYMESKQINQWTIQQFQQICNLCQGKGSIVRKNHECKECKKIGFTEIIELTEVPIPAGVDTGFQLMFGGQGHRIYDNVPNGDLILVTNIQAPPKNWSRSQNDIQVDLYLTLREALFGFTKLFKHLDNRTLELQHINKVMEPHTTKKISGEGFNNIKTNVKGDLFIRFIVKLSDTYNRDYLSLALPIPETSNNESECKIDLIVKLE